MRSNSVFMIMSLGMMVLTLSFLVWPITPAMPPTMATVTSKTVGCVIESSSGVGSLTGVRQAVDLTTALEERSDIDRMVYKIKTIM